MAKGKISVHTENLMPIIKKWLYSDSDIFLRELVSNAQDAISKLKKLTSLGEAEVDEGTKYEISVTLDKDNKTVTIADNGIGMTEEEVEKYISRVAFSGAEEFVKKYEENKDDENHIIGHFGLGFYSAFMVAEKVEIDTLSYVKGADAVHWESDGGTEYDVEKGDKTDRGTVITLHISDESKEFLDAYKLRGILEKYCGFLPIEIYFIDKGETKDEKDGEKEVKPVNDTNPLWLKNPSDCTDDDYKEFYHKVFFDMNDPLFWIHLNVDFPFNLKGIIYFPKISHELQTIEGQIKLYNNQVYIADNIKEVIPEYLMLLKGVIDCPDLPLNVSRSSLQNDGYVNKVSNHITKKVADKLVSIAKNESDKFKQYWEDINPFIKYGCLRDEKFYERVKDVLLFKKLDGSYVSFKDFEDKGIKEVFYVTDRDSQQQYIDLLSAENLEIVELNQMLDNHFVSLLEYKVPDIKFKRVDSYVSESLKDGKKDDDKQNDEKIIEAFRSVTGEKQKIQVQNIKNESVSAMYVMSEEARRMEEMQRMMGQAALYSMPKPECELVVNSNSPLVNKAVAIADDELKKLVCAQIVDMAKISHDDLKGDDRKAFISRTNEILNKIIK